MSHLGRIRIEVDDALAYDVPVEEWFSGTAVCLWGMSATGHFWPFLAVFWGLGLSLSLLRQSLDIMLFKENPADAARRYGAFNAWRMGGMMVGTLVGGLLVYLWQFPLTLKLFGVGLLILAAVGLVPIVLAAVRRLSVGRSDSNSRFSVPITALSVICIGLSLFGFGFVGGQDAAIRFGSHLAGDLKMPKLPFDTGSGPSGLARMLL